MNVLVTGANGFIGKNLCSTLNVINEYEVLKVTRQTTGAELEEYLKKCDLIFHIAGINRPKEERSFFEGNVNFTAQITNILEKRYYRTGKKVPIIFTSSTQVEKENPYGESKRLAEETLVEYSRVTTAPVYIYRLANIYGKWSKPNYNTVVATFCHNIARKIPIEIDNPYTELKLCYIDDVVEEFLKALEGKPTVENGRHIVPAIHKISVGKLAETIRSFKESRNDLSINNTFNQLEKNLYSTYLSFLPENEFSYPLKMNVDDRGSFTEIFRTLERGQVSVNISKPGIVKGNHWHHSKNEKFLVVSGSGVIRFRKIEESKVIEYYVSEDKLEVVDIPTGYTHNIENLGDKDMVTIMWANECFNPEKPDTYYEKV